MVEFLTILLTVVRLTVLLLAASVTFYSLRAYRRTNTRYLRNATIGFGIMTFGVFIEGALFAVGGLDLAIVHIGESLAIGAGFLVLLHSLRP